MPLTSPLNPLSYSLSQAFVNYKIASFYPPREAPASPSRGARGPVAAVLPG